MTPNKRGVQGKESETKRQRKPSVEEKRKELERIEKKANIAAKAAASKFRGDSSSEALRKAVVVPVTEEKAEKILSEADKRAAEAEAEARIAGREIATARRKKRSEPVAAAVELEEAVDLRVIHTNLGRFVNEQCTLKITAEGCVIALLQNIGGTILSAIHAFFNMINCKGQNLPRNRLYRHHTNPVEGSCGRRDVAQPPPVKHKEIIKKPKYVGMSMCCMCLNTHKWITGVCMIYALYFLSKFRTTEAKAIFTNGKDRGINAMQGHLEDWSETIVWSTESNVGLYGWFEPSVYTDIRGIKMECHVVLYDPDPYLSFNEIFDETIQWAKEKMKDISKERLQEATTTLTRAHTDDSRHGTASSSGILLNAIEQDEDVKSDIKLKASNLVDGVMELNRVSRSGDTRSVYYLIEKIMETYNFLKQFTKKSLNDIIGGHIRAIKAFESYIANYRKPGGGGSRPQLRDLFE